jgi:putative DNA primase/helicase
MDDIIKLAEARAERQRRKGRPPPSGDLTRPLVHLEVGELPRALDEAEAALIASDKNLYRFSNKLVTIAWDEIRVAGAGGEDGGKERSLRLSLITAPALLERFELAARFEKYNGRACDYIQCNCPPALADRYLARDGAWRVPLLRGIVTAPALRADGTVLDKPGYDPASGLVFEPLGVEFPAIPDRPTKADAVAALAILKGPIAKFPFVDDASRSVALSGMLTTVSRAALDAAPMHGSDALVAGSGKSKLADIAAVMATGHRAAVTAIGRESKGELEKKPVGLAAGGRSGNHARQHDRSGRWPASQPDADAGQGEDPDLRQAGK